MGNRRLGDIESVDGLLPGLHVKLDHGLLLRNVTFHSRIVLVAGAWDKLDGTYRGTTYRL